MKTTLAAASFALATTALSILTPSAPAVAEANPHGYVNYRNYDEGPESVAEFRKYHDSRRSSANAQRERSVQMLDGFNDRGAVEHDDSAVSPKTAVETSDSKRLSIIGSGFNDRG